MCIILKSPKKCVLIDGGQATEVFQSYWHVSLIFDYSEKKINLYEYLWVKLKGKFEIYSIIYLFIRYQC